MKPRLSLLAALLVPFLATATAAAGDVLPLIPQPAQVELHDGAFQLDADTALHVDAHDSAALHAAEFLQGASITVHAPRLHITTDPAGHAIEFAIDAQAPVAAESYTLDITPSGVHVAARDAAGLVHGAATLWQLLTRSDHVTNLPALHIEDAPRFRWRGLMLDSVRHMQSVAEIRTLLDQMALHKLNVLHWHLSDDQGWRIEIKRYPELTRVGAWRTPPDAGHDGEPARYGGYYTQDEIRALVRYAADRGITIVPELDLPGHATAAIASYPKLGSTDERLAVSPDWGVNVNLYNVDDSTFRFLENVLDEVMALFPSRYIHLGGDEAVKDQWQASPSVQKRMRALGLANEDELQGWFMGRLGHYLARHGRRMVGWDEILDGKLPAGATVMSWRGTDGAIKAARLGHDVVLSPAPQLYLDYLQSSRGDEGTGRLPVESLADYYAFEPVPPALDSAQATHVLGAQGNMWTEHTPTFAHVEHAVFPRLDALAEMQWTPAAQRNWQNFLQRMPAQLARYRRAGVAYADSAFAPDIAFDADTALATGKATVTLSNQAAFGTLRYTTDGHEPGAVAPIYRKPFEVTLPATVRVAAYDTGNRLLAKPRERIIDRTHLLARDGGALANCPGSDFRLRVQPLPDATSMTPVYTLPLFNDCETWKSAPLDGIAAIAFDIARLPDNYQLAHEAKLVVHRATTTAYGELRVHLDTCDGALLATLPLPDPATAPRAFALRAPLAETGHHDLCLAFAVPEGSPLYVFDHVALESATTP